MTHKLLANFTVKILDEFYFQPVEFIIIPETLLHSYDLSRQSMKLPAVDFIVLFKGSEIF